MREIKVGQFADGYKPVADGVVTVIRNYAYWLDKKYGSCTVFAPGTPGYQQDDPFEVICFKSFPLKPRPPYRTGLPKLDPSFIKQVRAREFDLVHAHAPFTSGGLALSEGKRRKIPVVTTFHSKYYDDFAQVLGKLIAQKVVDHSIKFYNACDSVWTVNEATAETLREYGYQGPITILPNGTDMTAPQDIPGHIQALEEEYHIQKEDRVFCFVGQQIYQKNTKLVIQAFERILKSNPHVRLLMIGEGYARKELMKMAEDAGLSDRITFTGIIQNRDILATIYLRASALVFPSIYDNAPLVVREAAAMGCPAILVRGSNAAQGVVDQENGFLCENNLDSLVDVIQHILDHPQQAKEVGLQAKETLARTWENIVDEVYEKYLDIIDRYHAEHRE